MRKGGSRFNAEIILSWYYWTDTYKCFFKSVVSAQRKKLAGDDLFMTFYKPRFLGYTLNSEKIVLWKVLIKYKVWASKQNFKIIDPAMYDLYVHAFPTFRIYWLYCLFVG